MLKSLTSKISRKNLDALVSKYKTEDLVLEIGSKGEPSYTKFFPNRIGLDIESGKGVDVVGSIYGIPFEDNKFETVLCLSVLEHLKEPQKGINEIKRVLKPGGKVIVSVPFMFPIHESPNDFWRFTKYGLQELFSQGWEIETLRAESNTQQTFAILLQRLGYQTDMKLNKLSKLTIFIMAKTLSKLPNLVRKVFGDIGKKVKEPEAFTNAFFLVAKKI